MNIYHCWRDFTGRGLSAVVQADSEERTTELLGWEIDQDTLDIKIKKIGVADTKKEGVWSEESL